MHRLRIGLIYILVLGFSVFLQAELRKENITVHQLANGLKILLLEDHDIPNIAYYTFFRVGSRNERPGLTGVSHFIEHMMFNGTEKFGPGEFDRIMEFLGGSNNAYTGDDMTVYTNWYPAAALEKMIALEADRIQSLIFDPQVLESERGVIASERRLSVENNNENLLEETVRATAIMAHPYHWSVMGWMSDILNWKRDEIMNYYRTYYSLNNAVVVVVGDFSTPKILEWITTYYSPIPRGPEPPAVITVEPPQMGPKRISLQKDAQTPSFLMVYHVPELTHSDFPGLQMLDIILLQGESSRLYRRLVDQSQLAIEVSGGISQTIDPSLFYITVKPTSDADLGQIEKMIEEELAKIINEGVSPNEIQKAKNTIRTNFYMPLQTIAGKANMLGRSEILLGGYENLFTLMEKFNPITPQHIQDLCRKYFTARNKTVGVLIPEGGSR
ncbi:MAG: pitrilysin family protein [Candidatus Aminicenantales bacterium]